MQDSDDILRLAAIDRHGLLHAALGPRLHALTGRAADLFDVPMAAISIVGMDACWFVGCHGFVLHTTPRQGTLGDSALRAAGSFVCPDAARQAELAGDELVSGPTAVRFYASAPIQSHEGVRVGGLVLMAPQPRELSLREVRNLSELAATYGELLMGPGSAATLAWRPPIDDSEALRMLRFGIDELPVILWTTDLQLRFTWAGGSGLTALHLTGQDVLDLSLEDFFSRDRHGALHVEAHRAALEGQGHTTEARFEDRTYRCRLDPLRAVGGPSGIGVGVGVGVGVGIGAIVGVIGIAVDITDRVQFEAAVRESEARYRMIARATNDVVRDWDIERDEIAWNAALGTVFRYPRPPDIPGLGWWQDRIHPDDRERVVAAMRAALGGEASGWNDEYRFQRGDGTYASVFDRGFITRDARGRAVRMLGSILDVTERKVMEAKLIQAERLASMGTLATGVAHEINNPLTYIMANVGYVSERLSRLALTAEKAAVPESPGALTGELVEVRAALAEAQEGAVRIRQIVRDLKVFARGDDDRFGLIDVRQNLESSISMVWNEIRHRARLVKELGPVPAVEGNESRLGQVFLNLLLNAAQAIREGDASSNEIRIVTGTDEAGRVRVIIEDTGVGIAPDLLRRIFDPFFTTKPVGLGTGLGLFICHGIIRAMGGDIVAESEVGRGARFLITLPPARVVSPPPEPPRLGPSQPLHRRPRVLIVDDEARVAQGLERTLSSDYDVVLAYGGSQAAELMARDQDFDVVLCDLMMPELTGSDLFARIESSWPELAARVVFMTGGAFTSETKSFLERVPNPRLDKPFDTDRLHAIIRNLLVME